MAMNFAMLYGYIPIKGKFMNSSFFIFVLFLKLSNFRDPFKKTTEHFSRLKCLSWGRTPSWGQKVSFLTHPLCFLNCYIYLNIISGCEGPPGKTGERGEHISICIRFPEESTQSSLEKSLYVIIKTNERIVAAASAYAVVQEYIFCFSIQWYLLIIFSLNSFLNFRSCGSPRRIRFSR